MKAVLVIDMPSDCSECPCCNARRDRDGDYYLVDCQVKYDGWVDETTFAIPSWCPLRPLPQREKANEGSYGWIGMVDNAWTQGFNDCLAEITGDTE